MGVNVSTTINKDVTKVMNESITNTWNETVSKATSTSVNSQSIKFEPAGTWICGGDFIISETMKTKLELSSTTETDFASDVANNLDSDLTSLFETNKTQSNEGWGFGTNIETTMTQSYTDIKTSVINNTSNIVSSTIQASSTDDQSIIVSSTGDITVGGDCVLTLELVSEVLAQNLVEALSDILVDNDIKVEKTTDIKTTVDQSNTGLDLTVLMMIVGICIGVGLLAFMANKLKGKKSDIP